MSTWSDDLRFAQQAGVCVDVRLLSGEQYLTGVESIDDEEGWVSLYTPQYMGDETTRARIRLDDITSLTVTDVRWE
jgi:hypothetical protein